MGEMEQVALDAAIEASRKLEFEKQAQRDADRAAIEAMIA